MTKDSKQLSKYFNNGAPITTQVGAYNTYVGARYVPIFCGEWDVNNTYEPLSIVTNEGNSYTSRGYVPKGIPITNGTYWALTGNFNGQLAAIDEKVNNNTSQINNINSNISTLPPVLNRFYKDKWLMITMGDSYSVPSYASSTGWATPLKNLLQLTDDQFINIGQIGSGFYNNSLQLWNNFKNSNPELLSKITHVVIAQGANEIEATAEQIRQVAGACLRQIKEDCPNARIILSDIGMRLTGQQKMFITQVQYWNAANDNNVEFIKNGFYSWMSTNGIHSDNVHPSLEGSQMIAAFLANYINSYQTIFQGTTIQFNATFREGITGNIAIYQNCDNGFPQIWCRAGLTNVTGSLDNIITLDRPLLGLEDYIVCAGYELRKPSIDSYNLSAFNITNQTIGGFGMGMGMGV